MNIRVVIIVLTLFFATGKSASLTQAPPARQLQAGAKILSPERADALIKRLESAGGCGTNVCFALDGSGSITGNEFELEKAVVGDIARVVSATNSPGLAAVQFGSASTVISKFTTDGAAFAAGLADARQVGGLSFVVGGINFCIRELFNKPGVGTVVLLGDGLANLGASVPERARLFRAIGGDVVVVAAGLPDFDELRSVVGGDESKVFGIKAFQNTESLSDVVGKLVEKVCSLPNIELASEVLPTPESSEEAFPESTPEL